MFLQEGEGPSHTLLLLRKAIGSIVLFDRQDCWSLSCTQYGISFSFLTYFLAVLLSLSVLSLLSGRTPSPPVPHAGENEREGVAL